MARAAGLALRLLFIALGQVSRRGTASVSDLGPIASPAAEALAYLMKTAIGLIGLGVAGGVVPTGLAGIAHAGAVIGGTAAALTLLVTLFLAAPVLIRRRAGTTRSEAKTVPFHPAVPMNRSPARSII